MLEVTEDNFFEHLDAILEGRTVWLPTRLIKEIGDYSRERKGRNWPAKVYNFIESRQSEFKDNDSFVEIHTNSFRETLGGSDWTRNEAKGWLKHNGFLVDDGESIPGEKSLGYWVNVDDGTQAPYLLEAGEKVTLENATDDSDICKFTRSNLNCLEFDKDLFHSLFAVALESKRLALEGEDISTVFNRVRHTIYPAKKLQDKVGRVFRDKTGRLHSPWTGLKSLYREAFTAEGESLTLIDCRAAQPSLLARVSGDSLLLADCLSDKFYEKIGIVLECDRDGAKEGYCLYAYGNNRGHQTKEDKSTAEKVHTFMWSEYREAAQYAYFKKAHGTSKGYVELSLKLMADESKFFIDGVLSEMMRSGVWSVSIHDALTVKESDEEAAKEIISKVMRADNYRLRFKIESTSSRSIKKLGELAKKFSLKRRKEE